MTEPGAAVGVRAVEQEQVREAGHAHPEVRARHVRPLLGQRAAAGADDLHRRDEGMALEAGGQHEHVGRALDAVLGADAGRRDLGDPVDHQVDVGLRQRRIPVVGEHDPLAADLVARRHLAPQLGVVDRRGDLAARDGAEGPAQPALARQCGGGQLHEGEDDGAIRRAGAPGSARRAAGRAAGRRSPSSGSSSLASAGRRRCARRSAGWRAPPGSRCSPSRRRPPAGPPGRRHGASARCGRPGPRSCRGRGAPAPSAPRAGRRR